MGTAELDAITSSYDGGESLKDKGGADGWNGIGE